MNLGFQLPSFLGRTIILFLIIFKWGDSGKMFFTACANSPELCVEYGITSYIIVLKEESPFKEVLAEETFLASHKMLLLLNLDKRNLVTICSPVSVFKGRGLRSVALTVPGLDTTKERPFFINCEI
jgi:hypothetical protein